MFSTWGALTGLAIAIVLIVRKVSPAYALVFGALAGGLIGGGSQFVFFKHYGIALRTGISSRGRDMYVDPTPDAAAAPSIIGGSTIDWFASVGLEYHWSL